MCKSLVYLNIKIIIEIAAVMNMNNLTGCTFMHILHTAKNTVHGFIICILSGMQEEWRLRVLRDRDGWTWHRRRSWIALEVGLTNGGNVLSAGGGAAKETIIIGCHGDGIKVKLCMSI